MICPKCQNELNLIETPELVHYAKLLCPIHGFIKWQSRNEDGGRKETSIHSIENVMIFHGLKGEPLCFLCLRKRNRLGLKETLTIDHIVEINKGGSDDVGNLQILCVACHKMKNWLRLYTNWHVSGD